MNHTGQLASHLGVFNSGASLGGKVEHFRDKQKIYSQGDTALTLFYIQHGGVTVATSKEIAATAGDVKVTPASNAWTEFNVVDTDGTVRIAARKGDLLIDDGKDVVTLAQGQETTRDETNPDTTQNTKKKRSRKQVPGATPAAGGGALSSPIAIGIGVAAVAGLVTWVLVQGSDPASPSNP